jgi:putative hydrolase of the HAD superfamily
MIKNVIFDLGGVILNIDYHLTAKRFVELGVKNFDELFSQAQQSTLFDDLETGQISPADFRDQLRNIVKLDLTNEQIDDAWNKMLLDLPKERIDILLAAKENYRTFLLSNTNIIHLDAYTEDLQKAHGIENLGKLFEKEYYSHEIELRKPNKEVFEFVLEQNGLEASETLFIDDSIQHIKGANEVGIHTFFMDASKNYSLLDVFDGGQLKSDLSHGKS